MIKGYKVFNQDWTCRGKKYEVGKIYTQGGKLEVCGNGLHFCKIAVDCFNYYRFDSTNRVAEVIAHGDIAEEKDKCCTDKLEIVREVSWGEVLTLVNAGNSNTGYRNAGDYNTGNSNTGYRNTGHRNTGDYNTGTCNTGDYNTGDCNTGNCNTGNCNTGHRNTGDYNTGTCNTGDYNTGDFNSSNYNTGFFCTEERRIRIFDIESDMTFNQVRNSAPFHILRRINLSPVTWVPEVDMTNEEKQANPEYKTIGGYLKKNDLKASYSNWWKTLTEEEKKIIKDIPNFNADKFKKITGITTCAVKPLASDMGSMSRKNDNYGKN